MLPSPSAVTYDAFIPSGQRNEKEITDETKTNNKKKAGAVMPPEQYEVFCIHVVFSRRWECGIGISQCATPAPPWLDETPPLHACKVACVYCIVL